MRRDGRGWEGGRRDLHPQYVNRSNTTAGWLADLLESKAHEVNVLLFMHACSSNLWVSRLVLTSCWPRELFHTITKLSILCFLILFIQIQSTMITSF